jgi:hypothetical protein
MTTTTTKATGAMIREFVDNHWPGEKAGDYYYEGYDDDPNVPDVWDEEGEFALDPMTEYPLDQFGEIWEAEPRPGERQRMCWPFSHFFNLWYDDKTRTHDVITVTVKVPRDTTTQAELEGLVREMIDGTIHHEEWSVVTGAST